MYAIKIATLEREMTPKPFCGTVVLDECEEYSIGSVCFKDREGCRAPEIGNDVLSSVNWPLQNKLR